MKQLEPPDSSEVAKQKIERQRGTNIFSDNQHLLETLTPNKRDRNALKMIGNFMPVPKYASELIGSALEFLLVMMDWMTLPAELITRKKFGIRYLTVPQFLAASLVTWGMWFVLSLFVGEFTPLFAVYKFAYVVLFIYHYAATQVSVRFKGELWHTESFGVSHFEGLAVYGRFFRLVPATDYFDDAFIYRWIEPAIFMLVGWLTQLIDPALGVLFFLIGCGLMVKGNLRYNRGMNEIWDMIDQVIESQILQIAVMGSGRKEETMGLNMVSIPKPYRRYFETEATSSSDDIEATVNETMGKTPEGSAVPAGD